MCTLLGLVAGHLDALREHCPGLLAAYAEASRLAVRIGQEKGTVDDVAAAELLKLLSAPPSS